MQGGGGIICPHLKFTAFSLIVNSQGTPQIFQKFDLVFCSKKDVKGMMKWQKIKSSSLSIRYLN